MKYIYIYYMVFKRSNKAEALKTEVLSEDRKAAPTTQLLKKLQSLLFPGLLN